MRKPFLVKAEENWVVKIKRWPEAMAMYLFPLTLFQKVVFSFFCSCCFVLFSKKEAGTMGHCLEIPVKRHGSRLPRSSKAHALMMVFIRQQREFSLWPAEPAQYTCQEALGAFIKDWWESLGHTKSRFFCPAKETTTSLQNSQEGISLPVTH